jgi:hypothetical protein
VRRARRSLTADDVQDVLDVISESVAIIEADLVKSRDYQARISEATAKLNDLARRLQKDTDA